MTTLTAGGAAVNPEFTVIAVRNNNVPDEEFYRCLTAFYPQDGGVSFDFIVVDETDEKRRRFFQSRFPWATRIDLEKMTPGSHPRNLALALARGDYVVFLEDHVTVRHDHLLRLRKIFSEGYDAVGGSVINGSPHSAVAWLQYFCEYHRWLPCRPSGDIGDLPGCNFAYRAPKLQELGAFVEGRHKIEWLFNARAKKLGARFFFAAEAPAVHYSADAETVPGFWRYRFLYGWDSAAHRGLRTGKRIVYALLSPGLAGLAFLRIWRDVRRDPGLAKRFWKMTPLMLVTLPIWAAGEMCGYLFGARGPDRVRD